MAGLVKFFMVMMVIILQPFIKLDLHKDILNKIYIFEDKTEEEKKI